MSYVLLEIKQPVSKMSLILFFFFESNTFDRCVLLLSDIPSRRVLWFPPLLALRALQSRLEAGQLQVPVITPQVNEWLCPGCVFCKPSNVLTWGCLSEDIIGENYEFM